MLSTTKARRRALAFALLAGFVSAPAFADERFTLEDTVVTDASGNPIGGVQLVADEVAEEAPAEQPVVDPVPMPEPIQIDEPAPMADYMPAATSCNCCSTPCCTKKKKEAATAKMKSAYAGVFYANDFSYLNDPCYDGPSFIGDSLKGMMGGKLDVGGEARVRFHHENNHRGLGLTGNDDNFFLTRYRMFANLRVNEYFRVYGEYLYADSGGETFNNRPIEENRGEIQNLFLDTKLTDDLSVRVGRQELLFGDQRLISPLDWANTRRTFQGVRGTYKGCDWTVDGFFVNPVNRNAANESKIDDANEDVDFYGVYLSNPNTRFGAVDYYYLGLSNQALNFDYHTIGSRWTGKVGKDWLYSYEGGTQFGSNSPGYGDHSAAFFTGGLGRQLNLCTACGPWKPTVWAWYDYASGGDDVPAARGDDSFDHLFPLAHKYLGFMDLFGRRNIHDLNFQFITPVLGDKVKLLLWYHNFWLDELTTPYNVTMAPFNGANAAGDSELGQEIDIAFTATINPRMNVQVGYSHFNTGDYYRTTAGVPTSADADFFWTQWQWRF
ncbi:alginate export family protein [Stieleria sp. JC731]|uniref:alginate export family protein n=1 Tax=Pirellulaceae TaxID=2691357 RepID=UPI001E4E1292|nr:alginate export family protein [Stieleria sp. JC731]MCC9600673.1 alginate export family protein [Stieleria sp. JC731]